MDADRFDAVIRRITDPSRRTMIGLALGGGLASLLGLPSAEAKKKKKKKKKCKGDTKKCGKKCIPAADCCSSNDCGGRACVNGACECPDGQFPCGAECVDGEACCDDDACSAGQDCINGFCVCQGNGAISCGEVCCDGGDQVCKLEEGGFTSCQNGDCPSSNYCSASDFFLCKNDANGACACTSTVDPSPQTVCINFAATVNPANCNACATSGACPSGQVCISAGVDDRCGCANNFCVPLCD